MNANPMTPVRVLPRDGDGGSGLSTGSIIAIVVVCACVGILILSLFLWRLLVRLCRPKKSAPLPPVQELAHYREQQIAAMAGRKSMSRPEAWTNDSLNSRKSQALYSTNSALSLLPERIPSQYTDECATAESASSLPSPVYGEEPQLHPPNPTFFGSAGDLTSSPRGSCISTGSLGPSTSSLAPSPSSGGPLSETASTVSHFTATSHNLPLQPSYFASNARPPRARSNFRSQSRGRRLSQMSAGTTTPSLYTVHSSSAVRGAPHASHSSVQIVLPAPLGSPPHLHPHSDAYRGEQTQRSSVFVDKWVTAGAVDSSEPHYRERSTSRHGKPSEPSFIHSLTHLTLF